ncbi:MAG: preprotein translocase subunit SecA, partial [Cetobacterium sp.]
TLASITLQNYFRMYEKLAGMTGTAETEASEFMHTYGLEVIVIPTNKSIKRVDFPDLVYKTKKQKTNAIITRIEELYAKGQPVLVGTVSIKSSEELSELLKEKNIPHNVLNAKLHEKEAEIIAQAGRYAGVTIATNMAGRGTDIMLGGNPEFRAIAEIGSRDAGSYPVIFDKYRAECEAEKRKVIEAGGLFILGTERHESRRIDNQLRGRAGRQGDPGASEFYLCLEDDLMRLFGSERIQSVMEKLGLPEGESIQHRMINKAIENAQKKVESRNFGIRKNLLEFDDVMNKQREAIYSSRNEALEKEDLKETILGMLKSSISDIVVERFIGEFKEEWDISGVKDSILEKYAYEITDLEEYKALTVEEYAEKLYLIISKEYEDKEVDLTSEVMRKVEKYVLFEVVDARWREHLKALDALREGIYLRSYGQKDPLVEYKIISGDMYSRMLSTIKAEATSYMFKVVIKNPEEEILEPGQGEDLDFDSNCICGSGKIYGKCCGRV